jgi:acyl-CoA thioester hydrolase
MSWTKVNVRVRYGETDRMGHVYYAHLLVWFEVARSEWCRERGVPYTEWERAGLFLPVVEVWVRYRHPVTYDEEVEIRVRVAKRKASMVKFEYEVTRADDGLVVAEGYTWHVLVNSERKPVPFPAWFGEQMRPSS